jgi:predicted nucleotide-binding protein
MSASVFHLSRGLEIYEDLDDDERAWVRANLKAPPPKVSTAELQRLVHRWTLRTKRPSVFVSHSSLDKRFVRGLARKLEENQVSVWLDEAELNVGDSLVERLSQSVRSVDFVLAVLSRASVRSRWVRHELQLAMTDQIGASRVKVLPLLKEHCRLPSFLSGQVYADFTTPARRRKGLQLILDSVASHCLDRPGRKS